MRRYGPAVLMLLTAAAMLRIRLFSDLYPRYVQAGSRPYPTASGGLLGLLGVLAAARARTAREGTGHAGEDAYPDEDAHDHDHSHTVGPRLAWLLALPATALLLFPPSALGSYSAAREDARRAAQGVGTFPALPSGDPADLGGAAFVSRAVYDSGRSLQGRTVRLTGFVTHGDGGTWYVTRLLVSCCAADVTTNEVRVRGADAPATDTWVTVTGIWHPTGQPEAAAAWPPVLDATTVRQVEEPSDPYEKR